jgi:predicted enzyme related to lactoylglutathione lyase
LGETAGGLGIHRRALSESFWGDDIESVIERLQAFGGTLLPGTRQTPGIDLVFLADPDGTRTELMAAG